MPNSNENCVNCPGPSGNMQHAMHINILKNCFRQNRKVSKAIYMLCAVTYGTRSVYVLFAFTIDGNANELEWAPECVRKKRNLSFRLTFVVRSFLLIYEFMTVNGSYVNEMVSTTLCFFSCVFNFWHTMKWAATDFKEWNQFYVTKSRHYRRWR